MDLNAFLEPGADLPIMVTVEEEGGDLQVSGSLLLHRGHPVWFCSSPHPPGRTLVLTVELPGFRLADDGGLSPAEPGSKAGLHLLSRVRACRFFQPRAVFVLRLELLGRIWPEPSNPR